MFLNNQNIMIYGSDEEKSLSLIGVTSGLLEFFDNATTSNYVDLSNIKFKKLLLCSDDNTDIGIDAQNVQMKYNINNIEFIQNYTGEGVGSPNSLSQYLRQFAEYFPSNLRGFTLTAEVSGVGSSLYYGYNIAFFA